MHEIAWNDIRVSARKFTSWLLTCKTLWENNVIKWSHIWCLQKWPLFIDVPVARSTLVKKKRIATKYFKSDRYQMFSCAAINMCLRFVRFKGVWTACLFKSGQFRHFIIVVWLFVSWIVWMQVFQFGWHWWPLVSVHFCVFRVFCFQCLQRSCKEVSNLRHSSTHIEH